MADLLALGGLSGDVQALVGNIRIEATTAIALSDDLDLHFQTLRAKVTPPNDDPKVVFSPHQRTEH